MIINIAIWTDPGLFGDFGATAGRVVTNPFINTFIKPFGNEIAGLPAWPVFETARRHRPGRRRALLRRRASGRAAGRGGRRDRRGRDRRGRLDRLVTRRRPRAAPSADGGWPTDDPTEALHGELRDELVQAMQRVPELAGRDLTLVPLSAASPTATSGSTSRPADRPSGASSASAGNDTHLLGISREVEHAATVAAAGVGRGGRRSLAFIRPEGYLVTRFIEGTPMADEASTGPR